MNVDNIESVWLITPRKHGKLYEQQCGGYACLQKSIVGDAKEVAPEKTADKLLYYFFSERHGGWCCDHIDEEDAKFIESLIPGIEVDRSMFDKSCEAWVHCKNGAVLIWPNSD